MLQRIKQLQAASQCCTDRGDAGWDDIEDRGCRVWMGRDETAALLEERRRWRVLGHREGVGRSKRRLAWSGVGAFNSREIEWPLLQE